MIGWFHLAVACLAMFAGAVVIASPKGRGRHVLWGRIYVVSMLLLNGSAWLLFRLFGGVGPFHVAALLSVATVLAGWTAVRSRRPRWRPRHALFMTWSYVGLMAAAASEVATRIPGLPFGPAVAVATAAVILVGGFLIQRHLPPTLRPSP